jgi:Penicillin binding protein transpeptidase domain
MKRYVILKHVQRVGYSLTEHWHFLGATTLILLPALYLPNDFVLTQTSRAVLLMFITIAPLLTSSGRKTLKDNVTRLPKLVMYCYLALLLAICVGTITNYRNFDLSIIGPQPELAGLFVWLSIFVSAALYYNCLLPLLKNTRLQMGLLIVLLGSIYTGTFYIYQGLRLPGMLNSPNALASFANAALCIALYNQTGDRSLCTYRSKVLRKIVNSLPELLSVVAIICVVLSQSKAGLLMLVVILTMGPHTFKQGRGRRTFWLSCALIAASLHLVFFQYFSRLNSTTMRLSLPLQNKPAVTARHFKKPSTVKIVLLGAGTNSLQPQVNKDAVPEDIAKNLQTNDSFTASHNLFLDVYFMFGVIGLLALVVIFLYVLWSLMTKVFPESILAYLCLIAFLHALISPVGKELTPFFMACLLATGAARPRVRRNFKRDFNFKRGLFVILPLLLCFLLSLQTRIQKQPRYPEVKKNSTVHSIITSHLNKQARATKSKRGLVMVMNGTTSEIVALSRYGSPPCNTCRDIESQPWQPGSIVKPLMLATALDTSKISLSNNYVDPSFVFVDDKVITNATLFGPAQLTPQDVITKSVNTGTVHFLKQLGDGAINTQAQSVWFDYAHTKFELANPPSYMRPVNEGPEPEYRYATSSFGIGITTTPEKISRAYSTLLSSGYSTKDYTRRISQQTSQTMREVLARAYSSNHNPPPANNYTVGGKTGTAPSPDNTGYYNPLLDVGTYIGYIAKDGRLFIMLVRLDEPDVSGFASSATAKTWVDIMLQLTNESLL